MIHWNSRRLILLFLSVSWVACTNGEPDARRYHPNPSLRVHPPQSALLIDRTEMAKAPVGWRSAWPVDESLLSIGKLSGPRHEVFGRITDVHLVDRRIAVLDARFNELRIFTFSGRLSHAVGGEGRGPGFFLRPVALDISRDGSLYILDDLNNRITIMGSQRSDSVGTRPVRFVSDDMCELDGRVYVTGFEVGHPELVREIDGLGNVSSRFATFYNVGNKLAQRLLSQAELECIESSGMVIVVPVLLPEIRAYSKDGELLWRALFDDFNSMRIIETERGSVIQRISNGEVVDVVESVAVSEDGTIVVQVGGITTEALEVGRGFERLDTYLLSAQDGSGSYVGRDVPLVRDINSEVVATGRSDVPGVVLYER